MMTPAPWTVELTHERYPDELRVIHAGTRQGVCEGIHSPDDAQAIAALPELLATAEALLHRIDNITSHAFSLGAEREQREALRSAIAKARGQSL